VSKHAPHRASGAWRSAAPARPSPRPRACVLPGCPTSPTSAAARTPPRRTCVPDSLSVPDQRPTGFRTRIHPGGNPGAKFKSISHRCCLREVAIETELTKETIFSPLGCLRGGSKLLCQETRGEPGRVVRGVDEVWLVREPVMRAVDRENTPATTRLAPIYGCLHDGRVGARGNARAEERGARAGCAPSLQRESSRSIGKGTRAAEPFGPFLLPVNEAVVPLTCRAAVAAGRLCLQPALFLDIDGGLPNGFARLCVWHKRRENNSWDIDGRNLARFPAMLRAWNSMRGSQRKGQHEEKSGSQEAALHLGKALSGDPWWRSFPKS